MAKSSSFLNNKDYTKAIKKQMWNLTVECLGDSKYAKLNIELLRQTT